MITVEQLQAAQKRYRRASRTAEVAREDRDKLIRQAAAEGWSQHQIARALELTQPGVRKILKHDTERDSR